MHEVFIAALLAACSAGKLDRTYLPPASSLSAGGTPGIFNTFNSEGVNTLIPGLQAPFQRTNDKNPRGNQVPSGSYENEHDGVVVDAAAPGTRASNQPSGLGGPRVNYGSTDSKVGAAAFRGTKNQAAYATNESGKLNAFQSQAQFGNQPQGQNVEPDLSAFYQPTGQKPTSSSNPGIQIFKDPGSSTLQYYNNIGLNRFDYGYETENGIKSAERGVSINGVMTQGSYSYMGDDGKVYSIVYTADKDGFRPTGSHLPTPPPIPAEIMESLQQNAKDEANGIYDDGSYDAQKYNAGDDYAQSDANDNYNDRQSNKFGGRPGYGDVGNTFINQAQQGFVRPNVQGHVSSYDYSNSKGLSIQPDNSFGAGASGFDNTKQMNKFFNQPGFFAGASSFNNQQSGSVSPNAQGQFSTNDFSNYDHSSTQHDTFKFGTGVSGFDNKKPSNTLLNQPGFNSGAKTFNNQGQQEFVRPNVQGHVSSYDYSNSKGCLEASGSAFSSHKIEK
ncbi:jg13450 [Pararge aegeria aegeria]|uniref:Jg13450 protein n=1 Tax=Pararge aegeria aegeria TaxID=348720 RepID=A0A8S4RSF3_9NEOP|nr:jg13450 [Pararge aegeria aegeria]